MKKLLVRGVFALGLVAGFGVGMAQSPSQTTQQEGLYCDDYVCNVKCQQQDYPEGWCIGSSCYCQEL